MVEYVDMPILKPLYERPTKTLEDRISERNREYNLPNQSALRSFSLSFLKCMIFPACLTIPREIHFSS